MCPTTRTIRSIEFFPFFFVNTTEDDGHKSSVCETCGKHVVRFAQSVCFYEPVTPTSGGYRCYSLRRRPLLLLSGRFSRHSCSTRPGPCWRWRRRRTRRRRDGSRVHGRRTERGGAMMPRKRRVSVCPACGFRRFARFSRRTRSVRARVLTSYGHDAPSDNRRDDGGDGVP